VIIRGGALFDKTQFATAHNAHESRCTQYHHVMSALRASRRRRRTPPPPGTRRKRLCVTCNADPCICLIDKLKSSSRTSTSILPKIDIEDLHVGLQSATLNCDACKGCLDICGQIDCKDCATKFVLRACREKSKNREYTWCEIWRHVQPNDCWLAAYGKVYDVSTFIDEHPGGSEALLKHAGKECSVDFDFHSAKGRATWRRYEIGRLVKCKIQPCTDGISSCQIM